MIEFESSGVVYAAIGLATLAAAVLPWALRRAPVSWPIVFLGAGATAFALLPQLPDPDPVRYESVAVHLTEICVIVSLMGAGLALNRPFSFRTWGTTWRLLAITMPLTMLAAGLLGWWALGLGAAGAVLLAAVLAPTDPVLATDVQVNRPLVDEGAEDDQARFALTSEAGLNDGLAFPFTYAAIAISLAGVAPGGWLVEWVLLDVLWRLTLGVLGGLAVGWLLGRLFFSGVPAAKRLTENLQGFVALAAVFLAYGATELAEGYGFVAVFVAAATLRSTERGHPHHEVMHSFVEQIERLLTVAVLVLLGGAVARGLLAPLGWVEVGVAALFLLVVRPVAGWIGLTGSSTGPRERAVVAFFGVRGVGSLYYVAYALHEGDFTMDAERLWAVVGLVVVASVVLHGVAATPAMAWLDGTRRRLAGKPGSSSEDPEVAGTRA
ncbi:cation transporter [Actinotalea ferrariae CF5-4]|uniref:Cation transporter n=1 Tax=Actinotalea ferrariae CF5-4 TaxID=948458 RepID=A0A021VZT8_9CELL|nr:cation:proton antiporter [Actinotalea ferrariae]EYR64587.1 cation transporter [Actinotalea ferrariae CF5-4]